MPGGEVELERSLILISISQNGANCIDGMIDECEDNEPMRKAAALLALQADGAFVRKIMLKVLAQSGGIEQAKELSILICSPESAKGKHLFREKFIFSGKEYYADPAEEIRIGALDAIDGILSKSNGVGSAPADGELGAALVNCALLDPSEKARRKAAALIGKSADRATVIFFMNELHEAEIQNNSGLSSTAKGAFLEMMLTMQKTRVRGSVLFPLIALAECGGNAGRLAFDHAIELGKKDIEVHKQIAREISKSESGGGKDSKTLRVMRAIVKGIASTEKVELPPLKDDDKTSNFKKGKRREMANPIAEEDKEGYVHLPGDPIGNFFRRRAYAKEQKTKAAAQKPQETKIKK
jgi:hypothetical protein